MYVRCTKGYVERSEVIAVVHILTYTLCPQLDISSKFHSTFMKRGWFSSVNAQKSSYVPE